MTKRHSLPLSRKILLAIYNKKYLSLMLNDNKLKFATKHIYLVKILYSGLDIIEHIDNKINKWKKLIGMMKRRSLAL